MTNVKTVAKINKVSILIIEDGEKFVPVKPICEALGIDHSSQIRDLKTDEILSSVMVNMPTTGSDKKQYEMVCIPYMYVFGWLFTINVQKVKPEAREAVLKYKIECYQALFRNFTDTTEFLEQKQKAISEQLDKVESVKSNFKNAKNDLEEANKQLSLIKDYSFETWKENNRQLKLEFQE